MNWREPCCGLGRNAWRCGFVRGPSCLICDLPDRGTVNSPSPVNAVCGLKGEIHAQRNAAVDIDGTHVHGEISTNPTVGHVDIRRG